MTQVNNWIIGLIDRIHVQFPHCGFSYAYELSSDQHVVELTDISTRTSTAFRELLLDEMDEFNALFSDQCILFTDRETDFPLEPPILYKKQPILEKTLGQPYSAKISYAVVSWMPNWPMQSISSHGIMGSISYGIDIRRQDTIMVEGKVIDAGEYNYGMAA